MLNLKFGENLRINVLKRFREDSENVNCNGFSKMKENSKFSNLFNSKIKIKTLKS
jgi:hypothetical protein